MFLAEQYVDYHRSVGFWKFLHTCRAKTAAQNAVELGVNETPTTELSARIEESESDE